MKALGQFAGKIATYEGELDQVRRWSNFNGRHQTTLGHTATIVQVGMTVLAVIRHHDDELPLNEELVLGALSLHDLGETVKALEGKDTVYALKSNEQDALELEAFKAHLESYPECVREKFLTQYLLQHVRKRDAFQGRDREILERLAQLNLNEAMLFELVERFDYLLYALNELMERGNMRIMIHTLRNQHGRLHELSKMFKGFAREYYTPGLCHWLEELLRRHKDDREETIPNSGIAA